jgi:hypothetical protein
MYNLPPKTHLLPGLGRSVERVIVAIQPVQQRSLAVGLVLEHDVGLLALGRGEVDRRGALGTAPVALGDEEGAAHGAGVDISGRGVDEVGLGLDDGARAAFVVDSQDLCADLELATCGCRRKGLEELDQALAVDDAGRVEFWDARDGGGFFGGIEVDYFLGCAFEGCERNMG